MPFDNYYPNRKDWLREYRGSKSCDRTCRNHGSCGYCERSRTHSDRKARVTADAEIKEYSR